MLLVAAANALFMFTTGITYPVVPLYLVGSGVGALLSSTVVTASSLVSFLSQVGWGNLTDRVGRRSEFIVLGGLIMAACYALASAYSGDVVATCLLYVLAGVGSAAVFTASSALMADVSSGGGVGRAMGLFWASGSLGWALPLVFAGSLLKSRGIGIIFALAGAAALCIAAVGLALVRVGPGGGGAARNPGPRGGGARPALWRLLRRPGFLLVYFATLAFYLGDLVKNIYVPQFQAYELGLGEEWATAILSTASWAEVPLLLLFGFLTDRLGGWTVFAFSLAAASLYMTANMLVSSLAAALLVMASFSIAWSSFSSSSSTIVVELSEEDERGTALGVVNANFSLANIAGPPLFGYVVEAWGYRQCFAVAAAMLAAAAALVTSAALRSRGRQAG